MHSANKSAREAGSDSSTVLKGKNTATGVSLLTMMRAYAACFQVNAYHLMKRAANWMPKIKLQVSWVRLGQIKLK